MKVEKKYLLLPLVIISFTMLFSCGSKTEPAPSLEDCFEGIVLGVDPNCVMGVINASDPFFELYWVEVVGENQVDQGSKFISTWNLPEEFQVENTKIYFSVEEYSLTNPITCNALYGYRIVDFINVTSSPCSGSGQ